MAATSNGVFLLLLLAISTSAAEAAAPSRQRLSCGKELVLFSPCLPYVSAPPNNFTATPTPECCSVFSSAVDSGAADCLCYLLRQPMILGFPLDGSRILSLSQICTDRSSNGSLESICSPSELPELPPLQNTEFTLPFDSGDGDAASSSPSAGLPPATNVTPSSSAGFPPEPSVGSPPPTPPRSTSSRTPTSSGTIQTSKTTSWIQRGVLIFIALYTLAYFRFSFWFVLRVGPVQVEIN